MDTVLRLGAGFWGHCCTCSGGSVLPGGRNAPTQTLALSDAASKPCPVVLCGAGMLAGLPLALGPQLPPRVNVRATGSGGAKAGEGPAP